MSEFKLSRICSEFDKGKFWIHQFGYDENNSPVSKKTEFRDYFYYSLEHVDELTEYYGLDVQAGVYKSIFDIDVCKVKYKSIKSKIALNRKYPEHIYEFDIEPESRYILDNNLEWSDTRNIVFFDIECWLDKNDTSATTPEQARAPITSIVAYSTVEKKYLVFSWHPEKTAAFNEPKMVEKDGIIYLLSKTEEETILAFLNYLQIGKVDVISGWYSAGFDLPYIINRCKMLHLDYKLLSPLGKVKCYKKGEYWKIYIDGLDHIDLMEALKDMGYNLTNWKLATAAEEIIDDPDIEKLTEVTWRDWKDNYKGFMQYAIRDVEILMEIEKRLDVFNLYVTLQQLANLTSMNLVFFKSMIVDSYILKSFHGNLVFPTRRTKSRQAYAGAIVLNPKEPGMHKDVAIVDYSSLYPTTVMAFNISPETFIASEESAKRINLKLEDIVDQLKKDGIDYTDTGHNKELFGKRYLFFGHSHKAGLMPFLLRKLYLMRREIKQKLIAGEYSKGHRLAAYQKQMAIKLILNSAYGAMGFNYFRLYSPECADAITYFSREALKYAVVKFTKEYDHPVLYGDTDSCFFKQNGKSLDNIKDTIIKYNSKLKSDFVSKYITNVPDDYVHLELELEKDLEYAYFSESKKRYYGIERTTEKKYIKGMNIIRKDAPKFIKEQLNELAELSVREKITVDDILSLRKAVETTDYNLLGITKNFSRRFSSYVKNKPQHLKASIWANNILGTKITHINNPLLFYVKSNCEDDIKPNQRNKAICILEEELDLINKNKDKFSIDYDTFFKKQVIEQLEEFDLIPQVKKALDEYEISINV